MTKFAIIDLGTNSVRFDIYDLDQNLDPRRIHREKQMVRLGDRLFTTGTLDQVAFYRTIEAFKSFRNRIEQEQITSVTAFGTAALRSLKNAQEFCQTVEHETGILIRTISGKREAELIAKGILANETTPNGLYALIDIGGGSTEVSICFKKTVMDSFSFNLGANRLQQMFLRTSPPCHDEYSDPVNELRRHVHETLLPEIGPQKWPGIRSVVGSSGTIRAIRKILRATDQAIEPFKRKNLRELIQRITPMRAEQIREIPGLEPKRVDLILAGMLLLDEFLSIVDVKTVFTSNFALRDGILEEVLENWHRDHRK